MSRIMSSNEHHQMCPIHFDWTPKMTISFQPTENPKRQNSKSRIVLSDEKQKKYSESQSFMKGTAEILRALEEHRTELYSKSPPRGSFIVTSRQSLLHISCTSRKS